MSGTKKESLFVAEPQSVYVPDPAKLPPQGNINLLELAKYAEATGKDISKMPLEEIEKFRIQ